MVNSLCSRWKKAKRSCPMVTAHNANSTCFDEITLNLPNGNKTLPSTFHCFMTLITQMTLVIQMASISFLLICFVRKQFHIAVNCYFSRNPQYYGFVHGMVLKQLNSSQLLTNSQPQGYI